jgi:transposase InsO family protein
LAPHYGLGLEACHPLTGDAVAEHLDQLIHRHGPPLFLKRDNGAVWHTEAVDRVLAQFGVLPLDSPVYYPRYNGGLEKQIGDLKRLFPDELPWPPSGEARAVQPLLEAIRHEFNARPRSDLGNCSSAERYHCGLRQKVDRSTRSAIFDLLWAQTQAILSDMKRMDHRRVAAAWRRSAEGWLRCQSLITVTTNHENLINQNQRLGRVNK